MVPANLNAPGQIVVSGNTGAVRRALEAAKAGGGAASVELKVSAPFHSPLMEPARQGMEPVLARLEVGQLNFGVIANVTAEVNRDHTQIKPLLLEQIVAPVRWEESMGTLAADGDRGDDRIWIRAGADGPDAADQSWREGASGGYAGGASSDNQDNWRRGLSKVAQS